MRKVLPLVAVLIMVQVFTIAAIAQSVTIKGTVKDATTKGTISAASVVVRGSTAGTYTDDNGNFSITVAKLPVTLDVSAVNYAVKSVEVGSAAASLDIELAPSVALGQEVVVSATRTPSRILESPVSIERVGNTAIRTSASPNFYDMLANLKGVDVVASSLTFKTPTTRGFAGSGNARFLQLMDGMDNQAPGLNFAVGSVIGLTELDVDNFELLQGASSALYGPGGMNGTMLINAKNPFKYQGLSFQIKTGIMHTDGKFRDPSPYYNWAVRWAQKVNDKFAYKIGSELIQAKDWVANDYRNYKRNGSDGSIVAGTRETDPNFDGVNVYGDETTTNLRSVLDAIAAQVPFWKDHVNSLPSNIPVSRTGYREVDIVNPNTKVFKLSGALHYKIKPDLEAVIAGHWGTGNTVYTGAQRYSLREFKIGQYKIELNAKNWFFRAFTTQENSGASHDMTVTTRLLNESWKPSTTWYPEYAFAYMNAKLSGRQDLDAHNIARSVADVGRPAAGSQQFRDLYNQIIKKPIPQGGLFLDRSDMYWAEAQVNLSNMLDWKFADVLVGGNYRQFVLNSQGTLFMKEAELIRINEMGAYVQLAKDLVKDKLRMTASGRYDKNQNFDGRFTPRVTLLYKAAKDQNIRLSYQTAYRFPTTQQQWIDLNVGYRLMGENKKIWEKYNLIENAPYNPANLNERINYTKTKPESVTSFELGYKALIRSKLLIDAYGYAGTYQNFISRRDAVQFTPAAPQNPQYYSIVVNAPGKVNTYGWGFSADYLMPRGYKVGLNVSSDVLNNVPTGFRAFFNSPKYRTNLSLGHDGFGKKKIVGFSFAWRWQDAFYWQGDFANGQLPAFHSVDGTINFRVTKIKSLIKVGGSNLLNSYYRTAIANPAIGGLYYVSFAYNVL
ncbi:MAG TPA: TonB-dependent receptor [Phnomibacter sp.]|nr:TonB-dependent receptor [Phnomibacter sp.]